MTRMDKVVASLKRHFGVGVFAGNDRSISFNEDLCPSARQLMGMLLEIGAWDLTYTQKTYSYGTLTGSDTTWELEIDWGDK